MLFSPNEVGETSFFMKCSVERMSKPLVLNVTASCYQLDPVVHCSTLADVWKLLDANEDNVLEVNLVITSVLYNSNGLDHLIYQYEC